MKERDCENCVHHTDNGCSSWDCEYKPNDLISRADAIEAVASITMSIHLSDVICDKLLALPSADAVPQLKQTDTLIIADALRYLAKDTERHLVDRTRADALRQQFLKYGASMCKGGDDK